MTDWKDRASKLLEEFNLCIRAKPKHDAVNIQLEKDAVSRWAVHLNNQLGWGSDNEIAEACLQLEPRLNSLKEKLVLDILHNGIQ
jgi:hypothetical protein